MFRRALLKTMAVAAVASVSPRPAWPAEAGTVRRNGLAVWTPTQFHAARQFAELPQGRIAYVERGSGPAALFLHGYPLNGYQWRAPLAELAGVRRCLAPDLMGLGYSDVAADADLSPFAQTAMLIALLDRLRIDRAESSPTTAPPVSRS
jgi:hypothetical protein